MKPVSLFLFLALLWTSSLGAEQSLDSLLESIKNQNRIELDELRAREQAFLTQKDQREALAGQAAKKLSEAQAKLEKIEKRYQQNQQQLDELDKKFTDQSGEFGEIFGTLKQSASETLSTINDSIINVQLPEHKQHLQNIVGQKQFSSIEDIQKLWKILLLDMHAQGKSVLFDAMVINDEGEHVNNRIVRVGPFSAFSQDRFLRYIPETDQLVFAAKQPSATYVRQMNAYLNSEPSPNAINAVVDPLRGGLLDSLLQTPTISERIQQGGVIAYIIIGIGILATIFALWRGTVLSLTLGAVRKQLNSLNDLSSSNPLGRVLKRARDNPQSELQKVETILEEGIVSELPKVQFGLSALKITAALAPLLGLLGTVTGMIRTFQDITLYGTGDPRMMAGGISQALVTTVLGLTVAVIIIVLHSWAATRSKNITQILDEQSAGLLAESIRSKDESG